MGKKKATSLKKETKELLNQHIDAATTPAPSLFAVDTTPAPVRAASNKKKQQQQIAGAKRKREAEGSAAAAAAASDAMDTTEAAEAAPAPALFEDDSDDEPVGVVSRAKFQRSAHNIGQAKLLSAKESKRLKLASITKAQAEAEAKRARPEVFDVWATTKEADLQAGIRPPTDARGFSAGRAIQRAFRHHGEAHAVAHVQGSVLPSKIHEGTSFHPDAEKHQELMRIAYEKDEAERAEKAALHAKLTASTSSAAAAADDSAAAAAPAAAAEDDSWMDDDDAEDEDSKKKKVNAPTSSVKYSKAKRNQMARAAANVAKQAAAAEERALGKFVKRLPVLVSELRKADKLAAKERERIETAKLLHPDRGQNPRLGKVADHQVELFPEVALTDELPEGGALRALKPSFNVVRDQFSRFQERHLIEPRLRVKRTKALHKPRTYDRYKNETQAEAHQAELQSKSDAIAAARAAKKGQ